MTRLRDEVRAVVRRDGVIVRRDHPDLTGSIDALVKTGALRAVLPGVYAPTADVDRFDTRVRALRGWAPDAVLTGAAAARLTFWPEVPVRDVGAATSRRGQVPGFSLQRRSVPTELVLQRAGLRVTAPALTALDLCDTGTDAIDQVLLTRAATLSDLWQAFELTPGRRGNQRRLQHLIDSRGEPWSAAERLCHRLLHEAGIERWESNLPVWCGGRRFYLDIAFADVGLVVEIDGRIHQRDLGIFENDRWRQNALVLDGWVVVRFTWTMLTEHPDVVLETIRSALDIAAGDRPTTFRHSILREQA